MLVMWSSKLGLAMTPGAQASAPSVSPDISWAKYQVRKLEASITILSSFSSDKRINFHYVSSYFTTNYNGFVEQPENKLSSPQDDILGVKKYNLKTERPISTICQIKRRSHVLTVHSSPLPAQLILTPQHCKWKHTAAKISAFVYL